MWAFQLQVLHIFLVPLLCARLSSLWGHPQTPFVLCSNLTNPLSSSYPSRASHAFGDLLGYVFSLQRRSI